MTETTVIAPPPAIDLTPFCGKEDGRFRLTKTWVRSGWKYAADEYIMVRVPTTEADTPPDEGRFPDAAAILKGVPNLTTPWPAPAIINTQKCSMCYGSGVCQNCGEGKCLVCGGKSGRELQAIEKWHIQKSYDDLIRPLPNVRYAAFPTGIPDRVKICFAFDGGEGAVMNLYCRKDA